MEGKCQTCLTRDRRLISTYNLEPLLNEIRFEELKKFSSICWECHMIILKFYNFKKQVLETQSGLDKKLKTHTYSKLTQTTKDNYDYEFAHIDTVEIKIEYEMIKQENEHADDHLDYENERLDVFVHNIENNKIDANKNDDVENLQVIVHKIEEKKVFVDNIREKKVVSKDKLKELEKKLDIVILKEEEMQRIRDEKRNNNSYKRNSFKCETCVQGFTRKDYFDLHMKKKHDEKIGPHTCPVCAIRFSTLAYLNDHHKKHYQHYKCILCDYKKHSIQTALNHIRDKHQGDEIDRIHCKHCDFIAKTPEELIEHNQKLHALCCDICGEKFKGKGNLKKHILRIHTSKREFICDICKKTFRTKPRLEGHMITHNQSLAQQLSFCTLCNIQYKDIYAYRNHIKTSVHHAEKRFPCTICNKKFSSQVYVKRHVNFDHLKQSQYRCELCNKIVKSQWLLTRHNQIYHGLSRSRDHACDVCHKKFYTARTLENHKLIHSDRRQFMCSDCGDTFKQSASLYTHCKLVHNAK